MKSWFILSRLINWLRRHLKMARATSNDYVTSCSWEVFPYNFQTDFFMRKGEDEIQEK